MRLLLEIESQPKIKRSFHIYNAEVLEKEMKNMEFEKDGFLTWEEFLELLFAHKRKCKKFPSPTKKDAYKNLQEDREMPDAYTSDPEMKAREFRAKLAEKKKKMLMTPKVKRAKSTKSRRFEKDKSWDAGRIGKNRITGQDYNEFTIRNHTKMSVMMN